ncbi:MAG: tRNA (N(6)-L-threonylcarbamoyladenosine(37)-C(2))-methylthiotransferase MtaB [Acidobacteria bacterium RIFCSPLOWO2_12_FULL_54_10]|nr:MAG: tRNA (N(6)-L-threonylcarbamoyladenosine(37)-C(2))-methylthiotransferase MtaB [Acidobacteria bacterium RIFCSPLOWO2_12_FULL_54_10]
MPYFHTINFGCRASQADGAALSEELNQRGFTESSNPDHSDLVVLNSCTVTASADAELRQAARRIHRDNPSAKILITGCYAQRSPGELSSLPGVRWIVGNSHKHQIGLLVVGECSPSIPHSDFLSVQNLQTAHEVPYHSLESSIPESYLPAHPSAPQIIVGDIAQAKHFSAMPVMSISALDRTRPNFKIQDGCNSRCSFCIIPSVRGPSRSLSVDEILRQMNTLSDAGYKEVVLSGINLGCFGNDLPGKNSLPSLLRRILKETSIARIRVSSVEPMDFTYELLEVMASSSRIARHIHAPLQSGSNRILRKMRRKYSAQGYCKRILAAFRLMPDAAFGADVMVGFPGETDQDFEETRQWIDSLPFTYLHVFPFSRRPGTPADNMRGQVHGSVVHERSLILRDLVARKNLAFQARQVGKTHSILTLNEFTANGTSALTGNYLKVFLSGERIPANQLFTVKIKALREFGLVAVPTPENN